MQALSWWPLWTLSKVHIQESMWSKKKKKPVVREAREWGREKHTVPEK